MRVQFHQSLLNILLSLVAVVVEQTFLGQPLMAVAVVAVLVGIVLHQAFLYLGLLRSR
jgi:hypothetical protein